MSLVIAHNKSATSCLNNMEINTKSATKSASQLALGERITNAGDDASAYSISEGLKVRLRGLNQCHANSSKGQNMLDIAAGAVNKQMEILSHIRELAINSANDTNSDMDRAIIQKEVSQSFDQIESIAQETSFNGKRFLNGPAGQYYTFNSMFPYRENEGIKVVSEATYSGKFTLDFSGLDGKVKSAEDLDEKGFSFQCSGCPQYITFIFNSESSDSKLYGNANDVAYRNPLCYRIGIKDLNIADLKYSLSEAIFNGIASANKDGNPSASKMDKGTSQNVNVAARHNIKMNYDSGTMSFSIVKDSPSMSTKNGVMGKLVLAGHEANQVFNLQTWDTSANFTKVNIGSTTLDAIFHDDTSESVKRTVDVDNCVTTRNKAVSFLANLDDAIDYLSDVETTIGAESARLDSNKSNLITVTENLTSANSVIRDTDMAKTMTKFAASNLLLQSSQAMLSHANKDSENVLGLLA